MPTQLGAVTGRPTPSPLRGIINSQAPFTRDLKRLEEEKALDNRNFALNERAVLSQEEQAKQANKIGVANVGLSTALGLGKLAQTDIGGKVVSGISSAMGFGTGVEAGIGLPGPLAPTMTASELGLSSLAPDTLIPGSVQGTATGGSVLGTAGTALKTAAPALGALGLELVRENVGEYAEAQVGTSAETGVNIAGRAGQGALVGSYFGPVGTGVGAAVGAGVGVAEETFGWMEDQLGTSLATILNPIGALFDMFSGSGGGDGTGAGGIGGGRTPKSFN